MKWVKLHIVLWLIMPVLAFAQAVDYPVDLAQLQSCEVGNFKEINTDNLEFSPTFYNDGIIYVASKPRGKNYDKKIKESFFDLKYYDLLEKSESKDFYEKGINDLHHFGPCAFNPHAKEIFYSENYTDKKGSDGRYHMKLLRAVYQDDEWKIIDDFPFNSSEYSIFHPAISADGQTLVFASNMPGGYGKMDLYSISKDEHGWSLPENLGPEINSVTNDWFPTFYQDDFLFYSSELKEGLGGLDIYVCKNIDGAWQFPQNLGKPINSASDDLGFALSADATFGFFSSDRRGGIGKDDIYEVQFPQPMSFPVINELVINEVVKQPEIMAPIVEVEEKLDVQFLVLDDSSMKALQGASLSFTPLLSDDTTNAQDYREKYIAKDPQSGNIKLLVTPSPILLSQKETILTQQSGKVNRALVSNQLYLVEVIKDGYADQQSIIDVDAIKKDPAIFLSLKKVLPPKPTVVKAPVTPKPEVKLIEPTTLEVPAVVGELLVFENVLYDYNAATIKKGGTRELEELASYMKRYPQLEVELSAHTDAIGSAPYNLQLSQRRADKAREFLIEQGVEGFRVIAKGYGEQVIRNHCVEGVICTDDEHAYNRRTELKIIKK